MTTITSIEQLDKLYAQPTERALRKDIGHIDKHGRRLIELSPFVVLATSNQQQADSSPRGGHPGFVKVVDEHTLLIPDWGGNNRLDTLHNLLQHPAIGLLFLIPGLQETLRINGEATLTREPQLLQLCAEKDKLPKLVIRVQVHEAYLHCAKSILRAALWDPAAQVDTATQPSAGEIIKDQLQHNDAIETRDEMLARYAKGLY